MPADEEEFEGMEPEYDDFVPAVFARNRAEADRYREILEDHDIPVELGDRDGTSASGRGRAHGLPVLVPDPLLEEASEIIADLEDDEEFVDNDEIDEEEDDEDEVDLEEGFIEEEEEFEEEDEEDDLELGFDDDEEDDTFGDDLGLDDDEEL
jgi:hypothetical protein